MSVPFCRRMPANKYSRDEKIWGAGNHCFAITTNTLKIRQKSSLNSKIFLGNGVLIHKLFINYKVGKTVFTKERDCYTPP